MTTKKEVPAGLKSKPATKPATDVDRQKVEADLHSARRGLVTRAQAEIDEVLNRIADDSDAGRNRFHGQTYAEGVEAGIKWLTERGWDESPYPDE